jgi:hypothetical protein
LRWAVRQTSGVGWVASVVRDTGVGVVSCGGGDRWGQPHTHMGACMPIDLSIPRSHPPRQPPLLPPTNNFNLITNNNNHLCPPPVAHALEGVGVGGHHPVPARRRLHHLLVGHIYVHVCIDVCVYRCVCVGEMCVCGRDVCVWGGVGVGGKMCCEKRLCCCSSWWWWWLGGGFYRSLIDPSMHPPTHAHPPTHPLLLTPTRTIFPCSLAPPSFISSSVIACVRDLGSPVAVVCFWGCLRVCGRERERVCVCWSVAWCHQRGPPHPTNNPTPPLFPPLFSLSLTYTPLPNKFLSLPHQPSHTHLP